MKALTIKQPWASLIINNYKTYELRTWKTNYRGKILIHAGQTADKNLLKKYEKYNISYEKGYIIGEATITDCIKVDKKFFEELLKIDKKIYGHIDYENLYAWKLENIKKYDKIIKAKGKLSLWEYDINN